MGGLTTPSQTPIDTINPTVRPLLETLARQGQSRAATYSQQMPAPGQSGDIWSQLYGPGAAASGQGPRQASPPPSAPAPTAGHAPGASGGGNGSNDIGQIIRNAGPILTNIPNNTPMNTPPGTALPSGGNSPTGMPIPMRPPQPTRTPLEVAYEQFQAEQQRMNTMPTEAQPSYDYSGDDVNTLEAGQGNMMEYLSSIANDPSQQLDPTKLSKLNGPQIAGGRWFMPGQEQEYAQAYIDSHRNLNSAAANYMRVPFTQRTNLPIDPTQYGQPVDSGISQFVGSMVNTRRNG